MQYMTSLRPGSFQDESQIRFDQGWYMLAKSSETLGVVGCIFSSWLVLSVGTDQQQRGARGYFYSGTFPVMRARLIIAWWCHRCLSHHRLQPSNSEARRLRYSMCGCINPSAPCACL